MSSRRAIGIVAVAGLAVAGVAGAAVAASSGPDDGTTGAVEAPAWPGEQRAEHQAERQQALEELAGILGLTPDELAQRWRDGESLADIAGDSSPEVEAWLTERAQERLAALEESLPERVDALMQRTHGDGPGMAGWSGRGQGHHGMGLGMGAWADGGGPLL
jgi:aryl-alcohol dehydrogenase-like predicted oxidoreductase